MIDLTNLKQIVKQQFGTQYLHMPYVYYARNKLYFLFDIRINNNWKIFLFSDNKLEQVIINQNYLNEGINQCNPFLIKEDKDYKFGFTYNIYDQNIFNFYRYNTNSVLTKFEKQQQLLDKNVYYKDNDTKIILNYFDYDFFINNKCYIINNDYRIMCIRPIFNTNKLIFTLVDRNISCPNNVCSLIYDKETSIFKYIYLKNKQIPSVYKCSIDPITEDLYYAQKIGNDFQERTISSVTKDQYKLVDTNIIYSF